MKKIAFLSGLALAFGLASCSQFDLPNPPGQSNPEVPVFDPANLAIEQVATTADLQTLSTAGEKVTLAKVTDLVDFPEAYELTFEVDFADNEGFEDEVTTTAELNDDLIQVEPADLNKVIFNNFTKDPATLNIYTRIAAYAVKDQTKVRLGGSEGYFYADKYTYSVTPFAPAKVIEDVYYLVGDFCGWDLSKGIAFSKTQPDKSAYDSPQFSVKIDVTDAQAAAGYKWKVVPASSVAAGNWTGAMGAVASEDNAMSGELVDAPEAQTSAGVISEASPYVITINVEDMTYSVALAFEYLWVPGQGSSTTNFSRVLRLTTDDFVRYAGVARLRSSWYLTGQASNTGVVYRLDGEQTTDPETGIITGAIVNDPTAPMMQAPNGFYYVEANLGTRTFKVSPITTISIIGGFNGWDTATAPELNHATNFLTWSITDIQLKAGEFKFCVNHDWALSFGGALDNLVQNGGNMNVPEDGTYDVALDFSTLPNTCTLTKK